MTEIKVPIVIPAWAVIEDLKTVRVEFNRHDWSFPEETLIVGMDADAILIVNGTDARTEGDANITSLAREILSRWDPADVVWRDGGGVFAQALEALKP